MLVFLYEQILKPNYYEVTPVRREDKCFAALPHLSQSLPQHPPGYRIHSSSWFIQKHYWWVSHQCYSSAQLSFIPST